MRIGAEHVTVSVPATSANLGSGFDCCGLALDMRDTIRVRAIAGQTRVHIYGEGREDLPTGEDHLIVRCIRQILDLADAPQVGIDLECNNVIPQQRGLGSSAAAIVAGLVAGRALLADSEQLDDDQILRLATELEGHPDNVAPALFGAAQLSWTQQDSNVVRHVEIDVDQQLIVTVMVPPTRVSTNAARAALPLEVSHKDAVQQASRAALLPYALGKHPELRFTATADRLHQQYRRNVMPASVDMVNWLREREWPAYVSGAGPTVAVLAKLDQDLIEQARAGGWNVTLTGVDYRGAVALKTGGAE